MEELNVVKSSRRRSTKTEVNEQDQVVKEQTQEDQEEANENQEQVNPAASETEDETTEKMEQAADTEQAQAEGEDTAADVNENLSVENSGEKHRKDSEESEPLYDEEDEDLDNPVEDEEDEEKYTQANSEAVNEVAVKEQEDIEHEMYDEKDLELESVDPVAAKAQKRKEKEEVLDLIAQAGRKTSTEELLDQRLYRADKEERKALYNDDFVIPLNGKAVQYKSDNEISHKNYVELVESMKTGKSLTGTVTGTSVCFGMLVAIVSYNAFRIMIPFEFFIKPREEDEIFMKEHPDKADKHKRLLINQRINSEVDFVIRQVDEKNQIAVGDRLTAMDKKMKNWYFAKDYSGKYVLNAGQKVEARIVNTTAIACTVEVFGREYRLKPEDLSYTRIPDVAKEFKKGKTIPVLITTLSRKKMPNGQYNLKVEVSAKLAYEDPRIRYFDMYKVRSLVSGVVTGIEDYGIFTRIEDSCGKIDILCNFSRFENRNLPKIGDTVLVQIKKKEPENFRIYGEIMHTLQEASEED